jgi:FMN-dependent NADH-azoreductase
LHGLASILTFSAALVLFIFYFLTNQKVTTNLLYTTNYLQVNVNNFVLLKKYFMKKILHIISSPRGEASYSIKLGKSIIEKIMVTYPDSIVTENVLVNKQFPHLEEAQITSFFTPPQQRTSQNLEAIQHSDEFIKEIMEADILVIGAPMYNFSIPSTLKAWIDHIARSGVTFKYDEKGPKGLVEGKKVYLAVASGGIYSEGLMKAYDFVTPYLLTVLGFLGITDVSIVRAEGTSMPDKKDTVIETAISRLVLPMVA